MSKLFSRLTLPSVIAIAWAAPAAGQVVVEQGAEAAESVGVDVTASDADAPASTIVVVGSRRKDRSVTDSAVPIDVIEPETLATTGYTDVNDALRTLVPAFNAQRLPLNDGSSFVRPITLRASPADHVLLLMNGKRRHRASIVQIGTGHATTSGSQGQDFNVIPPIALSRIEVLRDGASAQYGSDAIAGVVNMELRNNRRGGAVMGQVGQYYEGDGRTYDLQGNIGFGVGRTGFVNLSGQFTDQAKTFRGGVPVGAQALREMGVEGVPEHPLELGEPDYRAIKTVWNTGVDLGGELSAYLFGNYMDAESTVGFSYRQSLAAGGNPAHSSFGNSIYEGTPAHPEQFDLTDIYPGGYTPQFTGDLTDFSTVVGIRDTIGGFNWDVSGRYGVNKVDYTLSNTINPSLGVDSPTSFKPGSLTQKEIQLDADVTYAVANDIFARDILLYGGASYRKETYVIGVGDEASYAVGPLRDLPVGANGFQGFSPNIAGTFSTDSKAVFAEADTDITPRWNFSVAGRFEDYEAFGSNFSYKAATRYEFSDLLAVRGAISTGFRAPAAGQVFGTSQTSQIDRATQDFILDAVLVPGSEAAQIFGSEPLKPETSFNMSAGVVLTAGKRFVTTLDFYKIQVDDRLLLTPSINTTAAQRAALAAIGFPNGASVQQVRFFQNKLDTEVRGFDLVSTLGFDWGARASTDLSLAVNYNEQRLRNDPTGFYTPAQVIEFEQGTPSWRGSLGATHNVGNFTLLTRGTLYGPWKRLNGAGFLQRDAAILVDAELTYSGLRNIDVSVGARNLFDKYPPGRGPGLAAAGIIYDNHSVFGTSGGYYYLNTRYRF